MLGLKTIAIRYAIAVSFSYLGFFLFVKLWLLYIKASAPTGLDLSSPDGELLQSGTGLSDSATEPFSGSGGEFNGGGASGSFPEDSPGINISTIADSHDAGGPADTVESLGGLDAGDDSLGLLAITLLLLMVLSVVFGGAYLIWSAPTLLTEAAFQALLVGSFAGKVRRADSSDWEVGVIKATWWIFMLVLLSSVAFGFIANRYDPAAVTAKEIVIRVFELWWTGF